MKENRLQKAKGNRKTGTRLLAVLFCAILVFNLLFNTLYLSPTSGLRVSAESVTLTVPNTWEILEDGSYGLTSTGEINDISSGNWHSAENVAQVTTSGSGFTLAPDGRGGDGIGFMYYINLGPQPEGTYTLTYTAHGQVKNGGSTSTSWPEQAMMFIYAGDNLNASSNITSSRKIQGNTNQRELSVDLSENQNLYVGVYMNKETYTILIPSMTVTGETTGGAGTDEPGDEPGSGNTGGESGGGETGDTSDVQKNAANASSITAPSTPDANGVNNSKSYLGLYGGSITASSTSHATTNNSNAGDFNFSFEANNDTTGDGWGWDYNGNAAIISEPYNVSNVNPDGGYPSNFSKQFYGPKDGGTYLARLQPGSNGASITQIITGLNPDYYYRVGVDVMTLGLGEATFTAAAPGTAADELGTYHISSNLGSFGDGLESNRVDQITKFHTCYVYAKPNAAGELQLTLNTGLNGYDDGDNMDIYGSRYTLWADKVRLRTYEFPKGDSITVPIKLYDYSFRDPDTAKFFEFTWGTTEAQQGVRPGLVAGVLDENGRPVFTSGVEYYNNLQASLHANPSNANNLSADHLNNTVGMFREDAIDSAITLYKMEYNDSYVVDGQNMEGYYVYDSDNDYHASDCADGYVEGSENGFFPLCDTGTDAEGIRHNYHFGMEFNAQFLVAEDSDEKFMFTGDDDFWLFIDGVLVLDIGGVHQAITGTVNLANSTTTTFDQGSNNGNSTSLYTVARNSLISAYGQNDPRVDEKLTEMFGENPNTNSKLAPGYHDLTIYYMERSTSASNLKLITNLAFADLTVGKKGFKAIPVTDDNGTVTGYAPITNNTLVKEGDHILYTVAVENPSTLAAENMLFIDSAPLGTSFVDGSLSYYKLVDGERVPIDAASQELTLTASELSGSVKVPANETMYIEFAAVVDGINGASGHIDTITNTVTVNEVSATTEPLYTDPLDIDKVVTDSEKTYGPGDVITYKITVTNICPETLTDISLYEALTGQYGSWMLGSDPYIEKLEPGQYTELFFQYTVQPDDLINGTVDNTVTASVTYHGNTSEVTDSETVPVVPNDPKIKVEKAAAAAGSTPDFENGDIIARPGTTVNYYIRVTNTGDTALSDITVTDDHDVTYNGTKYTAGSVIETIAALALNESVTVGPLSYEIPADALVSDAFTNIGTASTTYNGEEVTESDGAITEIAAVPGLLAEKSVFDNETGEYADETTIEKGQTATYRFYFKNTGNVPLTITSVKDVMNPAEITALDWINSYEGFVLQPGKDKTFTGQVTFPSDISVDKAVNTLEVYAQYTDPATDSVAQYQPYPLTDSAQVNLLDQKKPDIEVTKAISKINSTANTKQFPTVEPGDVITYSITVKNTGNCDLNVKLTDICDIEGVQLSEDSFTLAKGAEKTVTATAIVPSDAANASVITNTATAVGTVPGTTTTVEDSDDAYAVVKNENIVPAIDLKKSVSPSTAAPGQVVTYTITVTNIGNVELSNVVITDNRIFDGNAVSTVGWTQTEGTSGQYTVSGNLAVGAEKTVSYQYTVPENLATGDSFVNIASVSAENPNDPDSPVTDTDNATVTVGKSASMDVTKIVSDRNANPGQTVTYTITVLNNGTTDLTNITVKSDVLSKNGIEIAKPADWDGVLAQITGTLKPGQKIEKEVTFTIPDGASTNDKFVNTITVDSAETEPVTDSAETIVGNDIYSQVTIRKVAVKKEILPGENAEYMIVVTNNSGVTINDLVVYDIADAAGVKHDLTANGAFNVGTLAPGSVWTKNVSVPTTETTVGNVLNTAYLDNDGNFDPDDSTTYIDDDSDTVLVKNAPAISIVKTANQTSVVQGGNAVFTITVKNEGNVALTNVVVTDIFEGQWSENGVALQSAPVIGTLAVGEEKTYNFTYAVSEDTPANSTITNIAYAESNETDKVNDNASVIVDEKPITPAPALEVTKTVSTENAKAGEKIYFQITVTNKGNVTLYNVNLTDEFTNSLGADLTEWALACPAELKAGEVWVSPMLEYVIPAGTVGGTVFNNKVTATANSVKDDPSTSLTDDDEVNVTVPMEPRVSIVKTADRATAIKGDTVTYTINVKNEGNCALTNVTVTEALTGGTWSVPGVNTYNIRNLNTVPVIPSLPIGATAVLEYSYRVTENAGETIENTVTADPENEGCESAQDDESVDVVEPPVAPAPALSVTKTVTDSNPEPGETVFFQITVTNTGNVTLREIDLTDSFKKLAGRTAEETLSTAGWDLDCKTTLAPGESWRSAPLAFLVDEDMAGGEKFRNTVTVTSKYENEDGELTPLAPQQANADLTVANVPALKITKTVNVSEAKIGDSVVYTIVVENIGNCDISNVLVTDSIPGGVWKENGTALSAAPVIANLEMGGSRTYTYTVTVPNTAIVGAVFPNVATAEATTPEGELSVNDDANITIAETPVQAVTDIEVTKNVNTDTAKPGETVFFWITVTNKGNVPLYNVTLSDVFTRTGSSENIPTSGWNLNCKTTLMAGESWTSQPLTYVVPDTAAGGEIFNNEVTAEGKSIVNGIETPAEDTDNASFTIEATGDFVIEKTVTPTTQTVGGDVFYTITVKNTGNVDLKNVEVSDDMLDKEWTVGELKKGDTYVITEKYTIPENWDCDANPTITNVAVATAVPSTGGDTIEKQDTANVTPLEKIPVNSIVITKDVVGETQRYPGDTVYYTILVQNNGETDYQNLKVTDDKLGKTWNIAILRAGESYIIPVTESVLVLSENTPAGEIVNTATLYDSNDNELDDDTAVINVLEKPQIRIVKTAGVTEAKAGEMVTYTIFVENIGNTALTNVRLDDSIPGGEWAESDVILDSAPVIDSLPVGGTATYTYTVAVPDDAQAGETVTNTAIVRATPPEGNDLYEEDDADITVDETPVIPTPSFAVTKNASTDTANVGDTVYFWITVTNNGETELTDITIDDVFTRADDEIVTTDWTFDNIPSVLKVNESHSFGPFAYTVSEDAIDGEDFLNTVTVSAKTSVNGKTETLPEQTAEAGFTVDKDNGINVTKSVTPETQVVGGDVFYTITVENTGDTALNDVTVTDEMLGEEWTIDRLESGKTEVFTIKYTVPADWDCTKLIENIAVAEGTPDGEDTPITDNDTAVLTPTEAPVNDNIRITKRVSGGETNYNPGDTVVYTILVENLGETDYKDLKVTDDKLEKEWVISELKAGETYIIPVAESTLILSETQSAGEFVNTATLLDKDGNKLDEDSEVINVLEKRELDLVKSVNVETAKPGDTVVYTILVTNTGNTALSDVTVEDKLGNGEWVLPESIPEGIGEVSVTDLGIVTVDSIEVGAEALQLNYNYVVPETMKSGETLVNVAVASATDTAPAEDSAVTEIAIPGLEVTKTAAAPVVQPGTKAEFYITVTNTGDTELTNVSVTDILPVEYDGEEYEANEVFAVIEKLEAGKHETFKVAYTVPADAAADSEIANTASATADNGVTDQDSDSVIVKVPVQGVSDFTIRKSANVYAAKPGATVVYNIIVTNTGNTALTGIVVSDSLPVTYNNALYEANAPFATIDRLEPGTSQAFEVSYVIPADTQAGSQIVNKATADPAELDPKTTECVIQALAKDQPDYSIVKVANVNTVHPGDTVTYSIVVTNTGNCDLVDFSIHDDLLNKDYYIGTLKVGQVWKTSAGEASYKVPDNAQDASNISNTASSSVLGASNTINKSTWTLVVQDEGKGVYAPNTGDEDGFETAALVIAVISAFVLAGCLIIPRKRPARRRK